MTVLVRVDITIPPWSELAGERLGPFLGRLRSPVPKCEGLRARKE
jgi:hypothetical protein